MKASLSLDLDNKWSYMKTHGDAGWQTFPSYLDIVVPRALQFFRERDLRITFFVVGQDAAIPENHDVLRSIAVAGHEIGNHSFHHEPWIHRRTASAIYDELEAASGAIENATGFRPVGFRGPGFSRSPAIREALARLDYVYDASVLATFIGPLARAYYFRGAHLTAEQRAAREDLFGNFSDGFARNTRHTAQTPAGPLEIVPVTTMPLLRTPIHVSYVVYLYAISPRLARAYFRMALAMCRATATEPSILLHPLDFLDGTDIDELRFFPGMSVSAKEKMEIVAWVCDRLRDSYDVGGILYYLTGRAVPQPAERLPDALTPPTRT